MAGKAWSRSAKERNALRRKIADPNLSEKARDGYRLLLEDIEQREGAVSSAMNARVRAVPTPTFEIDEPIHTELRPLEQPVTIREEPSASSPPAAAPDAPPSSPAAPPPPAGGNPLDQLAPPIGESSALAAGPSSSSCGSCGQCGRLGEPSKCPGCGKPTGYTAADVRPWLAEPNALLKQIPRFRIVNGAIEHKPGESFALTEEELDKQAEASARVLTHLGARPHPLLELWGGFAFVTVGILGPRIWDAIQMRRLYKQAQEVRPAPPSPAPQPTPVEATPVQVAA